MANINSFGASPLALESGGTNIEATATSNLLATLEQDATESISSNDTLSTDAFGKTFSVEGSTITSITLPTATSDANKSIDFVFNHSDTLVAIDGTINGNADGLLFGPHETCRVTSNGTDYILANNQLILPSLRALIQTGPDSYAVTAATFTPVPFNILDYETFPSSGYNTSTYYFTPLYPGVYQMECTISWTTSAIAFPVWLHLDKNSGTTIASSYVLISDNSFSSYSCSLNTTFLAAPGDQFQLLVYQGSASTEYIRILTGSNYVCYSRISNYQA